MVYRVKTKEGSLNLIGLGLIITTHPSKIELSPEQAQELAEEYGLEVVPVVEEDADQFCKESTSNPEDTDEELGSQEASLPEGPNESLEPEATTGSGSPASEPEGPQEEEDEEEDEEEGQEETPKSKRKRRKGGA